MRYISTCSVRLGLVALLGVALGAYMAMGCGSSSSSGGSGTSTEGGTTSADTSSLKSLPNTDVSSYDPTTSSSSSSSESVPLSKSVAKAAAKAADNKYDTRQEGRSSRAGCEQNMHKKEIIRQTQQAQLTRCYMQAFNTAGIFEITAKPTGYLFIPPKASDEEKTARCSGIPTERTTEREACLNGKEGPKDGAVAARVGLEDSTLKVDVCMGSDANSLSLEEEATYTGGAAPVFKVVHKGTFGGRSESNQIEGSLTGIESISDGDVTLSDNGSVTVTGKMNGGFGSGTLTFTANKLNYTLAGGFKGSFKDPFSKSESSFTGKAYAKVGKEKASDTTIKGTAKFSFTGTNPPMPLKDMMPIDMTGSNKENFITTFATEMGMNVTSSTLNTAFVCPNPNFDPANPSTAIKPMIQVSQGDQCPTITHTGIESFELTTVKSDNAFASRLGTALANRFKKVVQTFKVIADSASPFAAAVTAVDLGTISADAGTIAFERNWDCKDISATLDLTNPGALSADIQKKLSSLESEMLKCMALEENLRDNDGMGGHNCSGQEVSVVVENIKDEPPTFGKAGGNYTIGALTQQSCRAPGGQTTVAPQQFFINMNDKNNQNKYCIPVSGFGQDLSSTNQFKCNEFTVSSSTVSNLSISFTNAMKITAITFTGPNGAGFTAAATGATVSFQMTSPQGTTNCQESYTLNQPTFTKPEGPPPAAQMPEACKSKGITDAEQCRQLCSQPENKCFN